MTTECCQAAFEPREYPPYPDIPCHRPLDNDEQEPCRMAAGANCDDDKMAAAADNDETMRALDHIREMCLDRPCPKCKSEVIDKPQDDLRQCRACSHVWGFDDTQNLEEFVREFARMEPCLVCGNDSLDEFEVVQEHGRQELICGNCHSVQGTENVERDGDVEGYEVVGGLEQDDPRREGDLVCPLCPDMIDDFFVKEYDRGELVRVVCPGCSYVVFFKEQDEGIDDGEAHGVRMGQEDNGRAQGNDVKWAPEDGAQDRGAQGAGVNDRTGRRSLRQRWHDRRSLHQRWADKRREREGRREEAGYNDRPHLLPEVKKAMRYLCVKPIDLAHHAFREYEASLREGDENLAPRMKAVARTQVPVMAQQLGWTIGTAVGNVMFRTPEGAAFTGNVGSIVGRGFCDLVFQTLHNRYH